MKFYKAEMKAYDFARGAHTLQEWADFGYNKVVYKDTPYWDGLVRGEHEIPDREKDKLLVCDYYDLDEDGFLFVELTELKRR